MLLTSPWQWELNHTRCSCNSWIGSCLFWVYLALLYHGDKYVYGEAYWLLRFSFPNNHHKNIYINLHHTQEWLGCKEFLRVELVTQKKGYHTDVLIQPILATTWFASPQPWGGWFSVVASDSPIPNYHPRPPRQMSFKFAMLSTKKGLLEEWGYHNEPLGHPSLQGDVLQHWQHPPL